MRSQTSATRGSRAARRKRLARGAGGVLLVAFAACVLLAVLAGVAAAAPAPERAPAAPAAPHQPGDKRPAAKKSPATQAAYYAERLRENPVHIADSLPRSTPLSTAPEFAAQAKRTGVPTYVLVLPSGLTGDRETLLAAVHDRLGRKGLYVLLTGSGSSVSAMAFGVDVPARDASYAAGFELPYDADSLTTFTRFVDVLRSGDAAVRAREGSDAVGRGERPEPLHTQRDEREDQSVRTGVLLAGVPLFLLAGGWYVHRRRGRRGPGPALLIPVAAGTAVLIGVGASFVYGDTRSTGGALPTAADMAARTERVAAGLRDHPVYVEPAAPGALTATERDALRIEATRLDVPVRIAVVQTDTDDESEGRGDRLAHRLHEQLGEDGVYVVAGLRPGDGIDIVNHGGRLDSAALYRATRDLRYGSSGSDREAGGQEDNRLAERLQEALTKIGETQRGEPEGPYMEAPPARDPAEASALPPLYSGDFAGGLVIGVFAAAGAFGLLAAGLGIARRLGATRRALGSRARAVARTADGTAAPDAPARPSAGWLRRTARRELDELNEEFTRLSGQVSDQVRGRAWECLDAATLLLDQEGDSKVDADADAPTLAAGLALLRAGSAALRDRNRGFAARVELCLLNPLHGPATSAKKLKLPAEVTKPRRREVCAACYAALSGPAVARASDRRGVVENRLLRLRAPGGPPETYDRVPGPLADPDGAPLGAGLTLDQLVRRTREQLGVH